MEDINALSKSIIIQSGTQYLEKTLLIKIYPTSSDLACFTGAVIIYWLLHLLHTKYIYLLYKISALPLNPYSTLTVVYNLNLF